MRYHMTESSSPARPPALEVALLVFAVQYFIELWWKIKCANVTETVLQQQLGGRDFIPLSKTNN